MEERCSGSLKRNVGRMIRKKEICGRSWKGGGQVLKTELMNDDCWSAVMRMWEKEYIGFRIPKWLNKTGITECSKGGCRDPLHLRCPLFGEVKFNMVYEKELSQ